jgi:glycosyltransferase involved in cell wall biosynthesis
MRVGIFGNTYFPLLTTPTGLRPLGGLEQFILTFTEQLCKRGAEVVLFATDDSDITYYENKYPGQVSLAKLGSISRSVTNKNFSWGLFRDRIDELIAGKYGEFDFINNSNCSSGVVVSKLAEFATKTGTPVLATMHRESSRLGSHIYGETVLKSMEKSDCKYLMVSNSLFTQKNWVDYTPSAVINLGTESQVFDLPAFTPNGTGLFLGRISPEKAPHVALMAAHNRYQNPWVYDEDKSVPRDRSISVLDSKCYDLVTETLPLELIGNRTSAPQLVGDYCDRFEEFMGDVNDGSSVWHGPMEFTKHIHKQAMGNYYQVHPTIMTETFGLNTAEAMSVGVPSVVKDLGNLPNFILDCPESMVRYSDDDLTVTEYGIVVKTKRKSYPRFISNFRAAMSYMHDNLHTFDRELLRGTHTDKYSISSMVDKYIWLAEIVRGGGARLNHMMLSKSVRRGGRMEVIEIPRKEVILDGVGTHGKTI